jgi:hypothetical protein
MAAAQDVPGAKAVYEELKPRFPGGKRKSGETVTETIKKRLRTPKGQNLGLKDSISALERVGIGL